MQLAADKNGDCQIQFVSGMNAATGGGVSLNGVLGFYPNMKSVNDSKGFFTNAGVTVTFGIGGSADIAFSGTEGDMKFAGVTGAIGIGSEAELHVGMTNTIELVSFHLEEWQRNMVWQVVNFTVNNVIN